MTSNPQITENLAQTKVIVYKSRVDPATLKQTAEEMKNELFVKRFSKPKSEDIHVVSVDKHYEPYVLVDAKYRIEYFRKKIYNIEVNEKAQIVNLLGEKFKPKIEAIPDVEPEKFHSVIQLKGQEGFFYENSAYFILANTVHMRNHITEATRIFIFPRVFTCWTIHLSCPVY